MGDPRRFKKTYSRPHKIWDKQRLVEEAKLKKEFHFKNKTELWKLTTKLANIRALSRKLIAQKGTEAGQREAKQLLSHLNKLGLIKKEAKIEEVLGLTIRNIMERRLQTIVVRKGMAYTPKQARQFIVHCHILVKGKNITSPNYLLNTDEEKDVKYTEGFNGVVEDVRRKKEREARQAEEAAAREQRRKEGKEKPGEGPEAVGEEGIAE